MSANILQMLTVKELAKKARDLGLTGLDRATKGDLISAIVAAMSGESPPVQDRVSGKGWTSGSQGVAGGRLMTDKTGGSSRSIPQARFRGHFCTPASPPPFPDEHPSLPSGYHRSRLVCMVKSPQWALGWWDLDGVTRERLTGPDTVPVLRLYRDDVQLLSHQVDVGAGRYYVRLPEGSGRLRLHLGILREDRFVPVLVSNVVLQPVGDISNDTTVVYSGPPWLESDRFPGRSVVVLTLEQYKALFRGLSKGLPWSGKTGGGA